MDTAFFILAKFVGLLLQIETWLAIGLAINLFAAMANRRRLAIASGAITLIAFVSVGFLPLGDLLIRPLEAEYPPVQAPEHIDGIVVLGGVEDGRASAFWRQPQLNQAAERLTGSAALALRFPEARIIFSGGSGRLRDLVTSRPDLPSVASDFFASVGISNERVVWEDQSRNTAENAKFSFAIVKPNPDATWVLVTSAFHMGRALASFQAAGWPNIIPYPVDYRSGNFAAGIGWDFSGHLEILNVAIREYVGRLAYGRSGR